MQPLCRLGGRVERSRRDTGQPVARLELGCRQDDQASHRPPHGTMSCARSAAAGRPPAAPSPSSRRFRTSFSCRDRERDRNVEAERVAAEEETDGPADATHLELALQRGQVAAGGDALQRRTPVLAPCRVDELRDGFGSRRLAQRVLERVLGDSSAGEEAAGAAERAEVGELVELEREAQAQHDEHVDRVVLARDELAQRVGARPRSSQSLLETPRVARRQGVLERGEILGALVLRPGVGQRSGPGGIRQSPGDEQVDGPRELLLARDLLRPQPRRARRAERRSRAPAPAAGRAPARAGARAGCAGRSGREAGRRARDSAPRRRRAARRACAPGAG